MSDIPKAMLDRVTGEVGRIISEMIVADCLGVGAPENPGDCENGCCPCKTLLRDAAEAALRAALQPLPMESAPRDGSHVALYSLFEDRVLCTVPCFWDDEAEGWLSFPDTLEFDADDEDLIGWFPIIGGNHD